MKIARDKFTFDRLQSDASKAAIEKGNKYLTTYPEFVEYFRGIDEINEHNAIIGISFVYSWMPTILGINHGQIKEATAILNRAKRGCIPSKEELNTLKSCFNNSLVGSSKLLHFINPEIFAIWDSRVYRYLYEQAPHKNRVENSCAYLDYLDFCKNIINEPNFDTIHCDVEKKIGYSVTKLRALELIFFYNGANSNKKDANPGSLPEK